jgi:hypothetical protein
MSIRSRPRSQRVTSLSAWEMNGMTYREHCQVEREITNLIKEYRKAVRSGEVLE